MVIDTRRGEIRHHIPNSRSSKSQPLINFKLKPKNIDLNRGNDQRREGMGRSP